MPAIRRAFLFATFQSENFPIREHNSAKSKRLQKLVELSYDLAAEGTEADSLFLEKAIEQEKDPALKEALQDLDEFLFGY